MRGVETPLIYDDFLFYRDTNLRRVVGVRFNDLVIGRETHLSLRKVARRLNYAVPPLKKVVLFSFQLSP